MSDTIRIHTEFCRRLFRLGMPILRLWGTVLIDGVPVCQCRKGRNCPPVRAGKHMAARLGSSVIRTEKELIEWIEAGGNVGLSLHFNKSGAPPNPLRFVVFDDDDGSARAWLEERGITSPFIVLGRRGCHVYALLPDDVPDLSTKYNALKPNTPKMDLKTTGLMVLPMDNGKRLLLDGQEVTLDTLHLLDRFNSLDGLRTWLPLVDPRVVIPGMREREPVEEPELENATQEDDAPGPRQKQPPKHSKPYYLSNVRPGEADFHPNYSGIPYHERRRWAERHAQNVLPSIPDHEPWSRLVKVVNDCIHHYGMSDRSTWEIVREQFNPRCRYEGGQRYPWKKGDVVKAIKWAHEEGAYSTMVDLKALADPTKALVRLRKKGIKANQRRKERAAMARRRRGFLMARALHELDYVFITGDSGQVHPRAHLMDGSVVFRELLDEVGMLLTDQGEQVPNRKAFGVWLRTLGLETYRGRIRREPMDEQGLRAA